MDLKVDRECSKKAVEKLHVEKAGFVFFFKRTVLLVFSTYEHENGCYIHTMNCSEEGCEENVVRDCKGKQRLTKH